MSSDPHQGGDLSDMAKDGTSIPGDAGKMNVLPSVPRPDQKVENLSAEAGLGAPGLATAADNATDIPRSTADRGQTAEIITGTGDQMPATIETKNAHFGGNNPLAKGSLRYDKHTRDNQSELDTRAGVDHTMEPAPGQEELDQETIRNQNQG